MGENNSSKITLFLEKKIKNRFPDKIKLPNISEENKTYWLTGLKKSKAYLGPQTAKSC